MAIAMRAANADEKGWKTFLGDYGKKKAPVGALPYIPPNAKGYKAVKPGAKSR